MLPEYTKYVADAQRDEAYTLKQRRLWAEEAQAPRSSHDGGYVPHAIDGGGKGGRGKKKVDGRTRGRGQGGKAAAGAAPGAPAKQ